MNLTTSAPLLALVCAALLLPAGDELVPAATKGQTLRRTFTVSTDLELVESRMIQNGQEMPAEMTPLMQRHAGSDLELTVVDTYREVADGAPTAFGRTYETVKGSSESYMDFGDMPGAPDPIDDSNDLESDLEGEAVDFATEGGELVARAGEDSDLTEEQLAGLEADLTLAFLVPGSALAEGDEWEVELEAFERLLQPGGDLMLGAGDDEAHAIRSLGDLADPDEETTEGTLQFTHAGTREVDGRKLVVARLEVDLTTESFQEITDLAAGDNGETPEGAVFPDSIVMDLTETRTGTGELLWDAATGRMVHFELELDVERVNHQTIALDVPGMGALEIEQFETEEGSIRLVVDCADA